MQELCRKGRSIEASRKEDGLYTAHSWYKMSLIKHTVQIIDPVAELYLGFEQGEGNFFLQHAIIELAYLISTEMEYQLNFPPQRQVD